MNASLVQSEPVAQTTTSPAAPPLRTVFLFGVRVDNIDGHTALEQIRRAVTHRDDAPARLVCFTNVHSIHLARRHWALLQTINRADLVLPDGAGVNIAGRLLGTSIRENLNGTDFLPRVLRHAEAVGWSVYLFGARPDVLAACRARLRAHYPRLSIVGAQHGYYSQEDEPSLVAAINATQPDLLLVALGSPRQETWIARQAPHLKVGVCFAVGGLFDFLAGVKKRAPAWMRRLGIEWLFRFIQDPRSKWARVFIEIPWFFTLLLVQCLIVRRMRTRCVREGWGA